MTTQTPLVTRTDYMSVLTDDLDAAREFYGGVLGLELSALWGEENPVGVEFETGNVTLAVILAERIGMTFAPSGAPIALHVEDLSAARAELESKGVVFLADTMDSGVCHMAHFKDPAGNALMLHNRYAPKAPKPTL